MQPKSNASVEKRAAGGSGSNRCFSRAFLAFFLVIHPFQPSINPGKLPIFVILASAPLVTLPQTSDPPAYFLFLFLASPFVSPFLLSSNYPDPPSPCTVFSSSWPVRRLA